MERISDKRLQLECNENTIPNRGRREQSVTGLSFANTGAKKQFFDYDDDGDDDLLNDDLGEMAFSRKIGARADEITDIFANWQDDDDDTHADMLRNQPQRTHGHHGQTLPQVQPLQQSQQPQQSSSALRPSTNVSSLPLASDGGSGGITRFTERAPGLSSSSTGLASFLTRKDNFSLLGAGQRNPTRVSQSLTPAGPGSTALPGGFNTPGMSANDSSTSSSVPRQQGGSGLLPITKVLPEHVAVFANYTNFNIVQSKCFPTVYESDRNCLVSAPTGCGKTVIFELAILRLFREHTSTRPRNPNDKSVGRWGLPSYRLTDPTRPKGNLKAIYICPLKALCQERHTDWVQKFGPLGFRVGQLTGDTQDVDLAAVNSFDLIITTPEKWDAMTRRWNSSTDSLALMNSTGLLMIDEVHVLNETRGGCLEGTITRYKMMKATFQAALTAATTGATSSSQGDESSSSRTASVPKSSPFPEQAELLPLLPPIADVRFVALSATIPNHADIAAWLGAVSLSFGPEFRPVPLQIHVRDYPSNKNAYHFSNNLNYKLLDIIREFSEGRPTLVFCATRGECLKAAQELVKGAQALSGPGRSCFVTSSEQRDRLVAASKKFRNKSVAEVVLSGVGVHTAGLEHADRHLMESLFLSGHIVALCTTSTLAQGVNLPAHLVIIKGTQYYVKGEGYQEYPGSQIVQMIGRAGRPQFDTCAKAVIMTQSSTRQLYERITQTNVESNLRPNLIEHLNAEIVLGTIKSFDDVRQWLRNTYLYVRTCRSATGSIPQTSSLQDASERKLQAEAELESEIRNALKQLTSANLVIEKESQNYVASRLGEIAARYYLRVATASLINRLSPTATLEELIDLCAAASDFDELKIRLGEKQILNRLNKVPKKELEQEIRAATLSSSVYAGVRYPIQGGVSTVSDKVKVLLQSALDPSSKLTDFQLKLDAESLLNASSRILSAVCDYLALLPNCFIALTNALYLKKSLTRRMWADPDSKLATFWTLQQVESIGPKYSQLLAQRGIQTLADLARLTPAQIEEKIGRSEGFGVKILESVADMPQYSLDIALLAPSPTPGSREETKSSAQDELVEAFAKAKVTVSLIQRTTPIAPRPKPKVNNAVLLVGDEDGNVLLHRIVRLRRQENNHSERPQYTYTFTYNKQKDITINLIDRDFIGADCHVVLDGHCKQKSTTNNPPSLTRARDARNKRQTTEPSATTASSNQPTATRATAPIPATNPSSITPIAHPSERKHAKPLESDLPDLEPIPPSAFESADSALHLSQTYFTSLNLDDIEETFTSTPENVVVDSTTAPSIVEPTSGIRVTTPSTRPGSGEPKAATSAPLVPGAKVGTAPHVKPSEANPASTSSAESAHKGSSEVQLSSSGGGAGRPKLGLNLYNRKLPFPAPIPEKAPAASNQPLFGPIAKGTQVPKVFQNLLVPDNTEVSFDFPSGHDLLESADQQAQKSNQPQQQSRNQLPQIQLEASQRRLPMTHYAQRIAEKATERAIQTASMTAEPVPQQLEQPRQNSRSQQHRSLPPGAVSYQQPKSASTGANLQKQGGTKRLGNFTLPADAAATFDHSAADYMRAEPVLPNQVSSTPSAQSSVSTATHARNQRNLALEHLRALRDRSGISSVKSLVQTITNQLSNPTTSSRPAPELLARPTFQPPLQPELASGLPAFARPTTPLPGQPRISPFTQSRTNIFANDPSRLGLNPQFGPPRL